MIRHGESMKRILPGLYAGDEVRLSATIAAGHSR
jgi:hypothetical protein